MTGTRKLKQCCCDISLLAQLISAYFEVVIVFVDFFLLKNTVMGGWAVALVVLNQNCLFLLYFLFGLKIPSLLSLH